MASPINTPAAGGAARPSHMHTLSLSPRSQPSDVAGGDDDAEDVFSNPDTAELESRSDGTGATSPGPNSPGPSSPTTRSATAAAVGAGAGTGTGTLKAGVSPLNVTGLPITIPPTAAAAVEQTRAGRTAASRNTALRSSSAQPTSPASAAPSNVSAGLSLSGLLPSAHGLPSDPREASTLSTLFARPPAQSPAEELSAPIFPTSASLATAAALSRPATRPTSPARSPARSTFGAAAIAQSPVAAAAARKAHNAEESIFERDIAFRDSSHVLSKAEALDVAIPPVLDEAVEAIIDNQALEIVTPQTASAAAPMALSAQALSAHTASPLGSASPASDVGPPGSLAAQLAERFSHDAATASPGTSTAALTPLRKHRRPHSDASSSSGGLPAASVGVQQVLDGSLASLGSPGPGPSSVLLGMPAGARSASRGAGIASPASTTASIQHVSTPGAGGVSMTHSPSAGGPSPFPGLPLPDPFRSSSPAMQASALPTLPNAAATGGEVSLQNSLSMDGAIINAADVATASGSLGALADVLAEPAEASPYVRSAAHSPIPGSPAAERQRASNSARAEAHTTSGLLPGSLFSSLSGGAAASSAAATSAAAGTISATEAANATRRLSFFAYSDILNQTPGQLLDFDAAVRDSASIDVDAHNAAVGLGLGPEATAEKHAGLGSMSPLGSHSPRVPSLLGMGELVARTEGVQLGNGASRREA